jgi:hypothetical protein
MPGFTFDILYFILMLFAVVTIRDVFVNSGHLKEIPYSDFQQRLEKNEVKDLVVGERRISGSFTNSTPDQAQNFFRRFGWTPALPKTSSAVVSVFPVNLSLECFRAFCPGSCLRQGSSRFGFCSCVRWPWDMAEG